MKNLKLMSLILVIVSSSLFASNSEKVDFITKSIQQVPKTVIEATINLDKNLDQDIEINYNEESGFVSGNFNKANNEPYVQKKQNNINIRNQAARNYSYNLRSEIISKE